MLGWVVLSRYPQRMGFVAPAKNEHESLKNNEEQHLDPPVVEATMLDGRTGVLIGLIIIAH